MIVHLKRYPLSFIIIIAIWYLSFFTPPKTELSEITNFDKLVHTCMYGGFCTILWWEYLRAHTAINWKRIILGAIIAPITMSGMIELMQQYLTTNRSGDWWDFAANSFGVLLATLIGYYFQKPLLWRKKEACSK